MSTILNPTAPFTLAIGSPISSGASGSVLFIDSNGQLAQDNTNLNYSSSTTTLTLNGHITSPFGSGTNCERLGAGSGNNSASGNNCLVWGNGAGASLTTAADTILIGKNAGNLLTSGNSGSGTSQNVCIGTQAGENLTTGNQNVFIGYFSGQSATTCTGNFGLGALALAQGAGGLTGSTNVAVGQGAMQRATTASGNMAIGARALGFVTSASENVGVGVDALHTLTSNRDNTAVGFQALYVLLSGGFNTGIGRNTGASTLSTGSNNTLIGNLADTAAAGTNYGVALGDSAICQDNEMAVGPHIDFQTLYGLSSTNAKRQRADLTVSWVSSTDATRKSRLVINAWDTVARECIRCEGSGTVAMLGFFGASAVIQQAGTGETTGFTAGVGTTVHDDSTFTGNVGSTAYRLSDIVKALKNLGLLAA